MRGYALRALIVLVIASPLLLAMGGGGTPPSDSIPKPQERYSAEIVDRQSVTTRMSVFSCAGRTFFPLDRGEGTLMVPFSKVARVKLGAERGEFVDVVLQTEGGKSLDGRLPRTLLCTGATEFGNFQIELKGVKEIAFGKP